MLLFLMQVKEARENEMKINKSRELYRPVAQRATLLYFIIKELHNINPMYQYSFKVKQHYIEFPFLSISFRSERQLI